MELRALGTQGLRAPAMGLGCMGMSDFYGPHDDKESIQTIHAALDHGVNFLDTADMYGVGRNEELLGKAIKGRREQVILATKFGNVRGTNGEFLGIRGTRSYVLEACEASLRRLGVDVIDLYYQHRVDPNTPIEETVGAMADLVKAGKVRYLGLSEASPATIRKAHATHPLSALQTEYSLWTRDPESDILLTIRELGIGFVSYSPLGRGFLAGRFKVRTDFKEGDYRANSPRFQEENLEKNLKFLHQLEEFAVRKNCSVAQLALAWVLAQGKDIVPIPGTKKTAYVLENIGALNIRLSNDELESMSTMAPPGIASGARYPEAAMKNVNR